MIKEAQTHKFSVITGFEHFVRLLFGTYKNKTKNCVHSVKGEHMNQNLKENEHTRNEKC